MKEEKGNRPKLSDNLVDQAEKYAKQYAKETKPEDADGEIWKVGDVMIENQMSFEDGFIAGADWQKEQMMKDAVEGEVVNDMLGVNRVKTFGEIPEWLHFGDKVRIIIVKEDER